MFYRLLRPLLYLLPAETAHRLVMRMMHLMSVLPGGLWLLGRLAHRNAGDLTVEAMGLRFPNPIGLAAGLDKDGEAFEAFGALGFGFVEIGTLTALAQPGNPKPRLFRLPRDRALINRMGFNNRGAQDAAMRLGRHGRRRTLLGINIGKSKVTRAEDALQDYQTSARLLSGHADYMVVNVSSPNTPGLRDLQAVSALKPLLLGVQQVLAESGRAVPLLVKIAPDLADEDIDAVADLALEVGLSGIIATNTTVSRQGLRTDATKVEACGPGGLSGEPLEQRALEVIMRLKARVGERLCLIAAGGIGSPEAAFRRLQAGATLVQVYTALIYEGPALPGRLCRGVSARLAQHREAPGQPALGSETGASPPA